MKLWWFMKSLHPINLSAVNNLTSHSLKLKVPHWRDSRNILMKMGLMEEPLPDQSRAKLNQPSITLWLPAMQAHSDHTHIKKLRFSNFERAALQPFFWSWDTSAWSLASELSFLIIFYYFQVPRQHNSGWGDPEDKVGIFFPFSSSLLHSHFPHTEIWIKGISNKKKTIMRGGNQSTSPIPLLLGL